MAQQYRAKVFKSGNSVALRLPKAWGFAEGDEVDVVPDGKGGFEIRRTENVTALVDPCTAPFRPTSWRAVVGDIEQEERNWDPAPIHRPDAA